MNRYPDTLLQAEQATCAAALTCSRADVQATGLVPEDFWLKGCRDVWRAILTMPTPSTILLAYSAPDVLVDAQRWVNEYFLQGHLNPASLRAHAAIVKRESMKRQQHLAIERGERRPGWWTAYEEAAG